MDFAWALDCCKVKDDGTKQKTSPEEGPVTTEAVKKLYDEGSTVQLHQVQHHSVAVAKILSRLEDFFGDTVGCNAYLTPPGGKGLAPHYDTVDVFVCQVEGSKTWRMHKGGKVPEHALKDSGDLKNEEASIGPLLKEVTLNEGDMLYLPRGTVHYATAQEKGSAHLTISTNLGHHLGDLVASVLERATELACADTKMLRANIPIGALDVFGAFPRKTDDAQREALGKTVLDLLPKVKEHLIKALDGVADEYRTRFLANRLPPADILERVAKDETTEDASGEGAAPDLINMESVEKGDATIEVLCKGKNRLAVVDENPMTDDDLLDDDGPSKADGDENKADADKKAEEDADELYLVDCATNSLDTHMFDGPMLMKAPSVTAFPKRMKPVVDALFFNDDATKIAQGDLVKAGGEGCKPEDVKKLLMTLVCRGLVKF